MKQHLYTILFILLFGGLNAQTDTEFWFAAPEVSIDNNAFDRPIMLRVTAYNQASTITITQPANVTFTPIVVNIPANSTNSVNLTAWIDQIENKPANTVLNYGLLITATTPVTAYYEVVSQQCNCNPEIFALKGKNALGTNFFVPMQNYLNNNNGYNPQPYSSFDIIASEDNTTVTITPTNNVVGHTAGVPYNITLNRGQTYSATAISQAAAQHLMGSTVIADKPIAITMKDDLLSGAPYGGCADIGGDQLIPVELTGTKYAIVRGFLNSPYDKVFVLATQNNTTVTVDGTLVTTINTGQTYMVDMPNAARFIETSAPSYVLQLSGFGCEVGMSILPQIECTGSTSVAITRSTTESLFLNVIVRTGGQNNFLFNGNNTIIPGSAFAPVPGSGGLYQYAQITISTGQLAAGAAALITNSTDFFHLGVIHGSSSGGTRFGYFSNYNRIEVDADGFSVPVCEGFPIQLNANSPFASATYAWTGPNNFTSTQKSPTIPNAQAVNAGNYLVTATVSGCPSQPDTVPVTVTNCGQQISGIINTYTPVTAIDVCTNSVTVGSTNGFTVGGRVLIIQMKGVDINTTNSPSFGDITNYQEAGNYEFANVQSITGNQISFVNTLQRSYDVTGLVQLITVPQYSGNVHAINAPVTCQPWNGTTGGVVVFEAAGTLTLNADIDASDRGFRAGVANDNSPSGCDQQDYFYPNTSSLGGRKGEGVFELPNSIINGRGKNANGGGGGNEHNSGGAGGANSGTGGRGGNQWTGCSGLPVGGDGGLALIYSNTANKVFLGGGAGGGHQNDANATPGTNGGGIVIVKSNSITANGGAIKSFALNSIMSPGDGSGGAGAGGTVLLQTNSVTGNLNIDVHGGKGGDNSVQGTGGGGGGGIVWTNTTLPGTVTTNVLGGQPGFHSSTNTNHGATAGANGTVITGLVLQESTTPFTPLTKPVATAVPNICEGNTLSLSSSNVPNATYSWVGPNGFTATQQNTSIPNITIAGSGDYIVTVEDALNCRQRDTVTVTVRPEYTFNVSVTICAGDVYNLPDGTTATTAGNYTSNLQTAYGCDSIINTTIVVTTIPLQVNNDTAICRDAAVQLTASGGQYYRWSPATGLSDTTIANPVATPQQTTAYIVSAFAPSQNLITNGDFEAGNTGFTSGYIYSAPNPLQPPGHYTVSTYLTNGWWQNCPDHTSGTGNMFIADGADGSNGVAAGTSVWCQTLNVTPNTDYAFSTWLTNLNSTGATSQLRFTINGVQIGADQNTPLGVCQWNQFYVIWNSGNSTTANICIAEASGAQPGNDFALDDISFSRLCEEIDTVVITVNYPDTTILNPVICADAIYTLPDGNTTNVQGQYVDTFQTVNGCDSIVITNLTVYPVYSFNVSTTICNGDIYTLPGGGTATTAGTYNDTLQTINGCDSIINTTIAVTTIPLQVSNDTAICPNNAVQLNAAGGQYYRWQPAAGLTDTTIANPVATPQQTTAYIVSAFAPSQNLIANGDFEGGNTGFTSSYQYKTPPNTNEGQYFIGPNAQAWNGGMSACGDHTTGTGNMMLVNGATTQNQSVWCQAINVLPNTDYAFSTWLQMVVNNNPAILQFSINGNLLGAPFTAPSTQCQWAEFYQIWNSGSNTTANICIVNQNTNAGGNDFALDDISFARLCEEIDTVVVTILQPDTTIINPEVCYGATYTLPDGDTTSIQGIYIDTLQTTLGCDSIIITNLTVNPVYDDTVTASICDGVVYSLPDGNTATTTGVYVANLQTIKGCDSIITTILDVRPNSFTTVDTLVCPGTQYVRPAGGIATAVGTYSDILPSANGCDSVITTNIQYHPVYSQTITDTICLGDTYTLPDGNTATQTNTYNIVLQTVNGCDSAFTVNLTALSVSLQTTQANNVCFGESRGAITVTATGGVSAYTFVLDGSTTQTGATSTTFNSLPIGTYNIDATDAKGCTATISATITEPSLLTATGTPTNVTCFGFADGTVQVVAAGGTTPYTYTLNGEQNSSGYFEGLTAGSYTVSVTDANQCSTTYQFSITEPDAVQINLLPVSPLVLSLGGKDTVRVSSNYDPAVTYNWNPSAGLSCDDCAVLLVKPLNSITYTVVANATVNGNTCVAETTLDVIVEPDYTVYVPNMFTPNNDGINDFFGWFGNKDAMKFMEVKIFNRWGEKVFESNDKNFLWDGYYGGEPAPSDNYIYTIKVTWIDGYTGKMYKGSVMLVR